MSPHAPRWTRFCTHPWGVSAARCYGTVETAPTMSREGKKQPYGTVSRYVSREYSPACRPQLRPV